MSSARVCIKKFPLTDEGDMATFSKILADSGDASVAVDVVIKSIKADFRELSGIVKAEGGILPKLRMPKGKSKAKPKPVLDYTAQTLDQAIEDGVITYEAALQMANTATGMSTPEASIWLADNTEAETTLDLTPRQYEQRNGWINAGVEQTLITYAESNPEVFNDVEVIKDEEGLGFVESVQQAVRRHREPTDKESAIPNVETRLTPAEVQAKMDARLHKNKYIQSEKEAEAELVAAFGSKFKNIFFKSGPHPTGRNVFGSYNHGTGNIRIWYENVEKGTLAETIIHEKGVHEILAQDKSLKAEYKAVLDRMEVLLKDGNEEVFEARNRAIATFISKNERPPTSISDNKIVAEETIAYLMNAGVSRGWFNKFKRQVRKTFKNFFDIDLNPDDLRILVTELVKTQATKVQKELDAETDAKAKKDAEDARIEADLLAAFDNDGDMNSEGYESLKGYGAINNSPTMKAAVTEDVKGATDPAYVGKTAFAPTTLYGAVWDAVHGDLGGVVDVVTNASHYGKEQWLKWMPQSEVIKDAVRKGMASFSKLEDLTDRTRAEAHGNIQDAQDNVLNPVRDLQKNNLAEYNTIVDMMQNSTVNNKDAKLTRKFKNLSKEAQDAYVSVENYYRDQADKYIGALQKQLDSLNTDGKAKKELQAYIDVFKRDSNSKIYFPLQRFGRFRLDAVDRNGEDYVSFSDSIAELKAEERNLVKSGFTVTGVGQVAKFSSDAQKVMDESSFKKAERLVDELGGNEQAKEALWKVFMQMAPSNQLKDRMSKRRNVAGASKDLVRGLATTIGFYRDIARRNNAIEKASIYEEAVVEMKAMDSEGKLAAEQVYEELQFREDMAAKPRAGWSSGLSKMNFIVNLGFNPSSAIINLTQNAIVGVPYLGSKFGAIRTATVMSESLSDSFRVLYNLKMNKKNILEGDELDAYNFWRKAGTFDDTQSMMHTQLSDSTSTGTDSKSDWVMEKSAWMFHNAELANRITAGLTAYRLAKESGMSHQEAKEYSSKAIIEIHFDYAEEGKSRLQRTDIGGVALAFKSYPIKMAYYMMNNVKAMVRGETAEVRQEAYKQFFGTMAVTSMFGGAMALPLNSLLMIVLDGFSDDDDWDAHKAFKEWSVEVAGETGGAILTNGLISHITGIDLTGRVSLDKMFYRIPEGGGTPKAWADEAVASVVGPIGSRLASIPKGMDLMYEGKFFTGMEKFMPAVYSNSSKALRFGYKGEAHNAYDSLMEKDFDGLDTFWRAAGFTSREYAETSSDYWTDKRIERTAKNKKKRILRDAAMSVIVGDAGNKQRVRALVREWNRTHGADEAITQSSIKRRVKDLRNKLEGNE